MRAVIYARYSEGPRQTDQSIEGQVADCTAYAEAHGMTVIGLYADRHISGKSVEGREEFQRMMHDADHHRFDAVITWKIDRFGRNREDIAVNKIRLRHAGVQLHYAMESLPEGPEGILLEALLEGLAEYYSEDLRQKILRGIREGAKKGKAPGGSTPIGYRRGEDGRVEVDPAAAEAVREIFRMHLQGATLDAMQDELLARGVTSRRGDRPAPALVHRILRNEKYLGRWTVQGIDLPVEPIIDEATFEAAAELFKTSRNARADVDYLLSGKCYCKICGGKMTGKSGTGKLGKKYHYYACRTKGCSMSPVPKNALEDQVVRITCEDILNDEMIGKLTAAIMEIQQAEHEQDPAAALEKRLEQTRNRIRNVLTAMEMSPSKALAARLDELEAEAEELSAEIARARLARPVVPESLVRGWLESFRDGDKDDPQVRRRLLRSFVGLVEIDPEYVTVYYNTTQKKDPGEGSPGATELEIAKTGANTPRICGGYIVIRAPLV